MELTKTQTRIGRRMLELAKGGSDWQHVPDPYGFIIRITREVKTPDYAKGNGYWSDETYDRHVFLTLGSWGVILGDATCPWVGRNDSTIPYWLAETILAAEDPFAVVDNRVALTRARKVAPPAKTQKDKARLSPKMIRALEVTGLDDIMAPGPTRAALMRRGLVFKREGNGRFGYFTDAGREIAAELQRARRDRS